MQSTRGCGLCSPGGEQPPPEGLPLLDLAPAGGYLAVNVTIYAGGLLHHLFTLATSRPIPSNSENYGEDQVEFAVYFCGPIRQVAPSRGLPGILPCGVRTFLNGSRHCGHPVSLGILMIP